jgi:hypothetical protein
LPEKRWIESVDQEKAEINKRIKITIGIAGKIS